MSICTVNGTTWRSCKRWLESLVDLPDVIAIQEHKLNSQPDIEEASAYLDKMGYGSVWGKQPPAQRTTQWEGWL